MAPRFVPAEHQLRRCIYLIYVPRNNIRSTQFSHNLTKKRRAQKMASLCNYSHPELQNTSGLERHGAGVLFPYNPEFYERSSGLYGPGSIIAWYLLFVSVAINGLGNIARSKEPGAQQAEKTTLLSKSADLVVLVAYPVFAATDLLVQSIRLRGTEHRALVLFCLRNPVVELRGFGGEFPQSPLELAKIPPDVLSLGRRIVDQTGPLSVCYTSAVLFFVPLVVLCAADAIETSGSDPALSRDALPGIILLLGGFAYVVLILFVFHCLLGSFWIGFFIFLYEFVGLLLKVMSIGVALVFVAALLRTFFGWYEERFIKRNLDKAWEEAKALGGLLIGTAIIPTLFVGLMVFNQAMIIPDSGIAIGERDQLAALIAGIMALLYSTYSVVKEHRKRQRRVEGDPSCAELTLEERLLQHGEELREEGSGSLTRQRRASV